MGSKVAVRGTCRSMRIWALLLLTAVVCCALSVETLGITTSWKQKPASSSLEVGAVFSGGTRTVTGMQITVVNAGDSAVTIDWDACSLTMPSGRTERIIHTGVRYLNSAMPQASTTIPPNGYISESIWPSTYTTWRKPLFWGLLGDPTWVRERISLPASVGTLGLFLTWSDNAGRHDGTWTWTIQEDARKGFHLSPFWQWVLGGYLILALIAAVLSPFTE